MTHETITALADLLMGMDHDTEQAARGILDAIAANAIPGVCMVVERDAASKDADRFQDALFKCHKERDAALGRYADAVIEGGRLKAECAGLRTFHETALCCLSREDLASIASLMSERTPTPAAERGGGKS